MFEHHLPLQWNGENPGESKVYRHFAAIRINGFHFFICATLLHILFSGSYFIVFPLTFSHLLYVFLRSRVYGIAIWNKLCLPKTLFLNNQKILFLLLDDFYTLVAAYYSDISSFFKVSVKLSCNSSFQRAFTACVCVFKVIYLGWFKPVELLWKSKCVQ
jgi:hypothetical protein